MEITGVFGSCPPDSSWADASRISARTSCQEQLGGLCQILHNMEPICALGSLGSAKCCGSGIFPSTISTYHENIWLLAHPGGCSFRFSKRREDRLPYGFPNSRGSCRTDSRVETRNRRCPKRALIRSKPLAEPECGAGSFGQRSVSLNGQRAWHHLCHRWRVRRR